MKIKLFISLIVVLFIVGCADFLNEKNETDLNTDFVYNTPEGIGLAVVALYSKERDLSGSGNSENSLAASTLLSGDDITFTRAGESSGEWQGPAWYEPSKLNSDNGDVEGFWKYNYNIIGKANEIIYYALKLDQSNPLVIQALSETYCFRAHAYFNLLRRFDNIYFTTTAITPYNVNSPVNYQVATQVEVMTQIKQDLDFAIEHLAWTTLQKGRFTKGFACHVKALADMWPVNGESSSMDLDDAIVQIENIKNSGTYTLMPEPKDVFTPMSTSATSAKLNNSESIFVHQWSNEIGGAALNYQGTLSGHRFASATLTRYDRSTILNGSTGASLITDMLQGGVSWGRVYPNDYLLGLYDKINDKRYNQYYKHTFTFNNIPVGTPLVRKLIIQSHDIKYLYINGLPNQNLGLPANIVAQLQTYLPNFASVAINKTLNFSFVNGDVVPKFMVSSGTNNFAYSLHSCSTKYFDKWTRDVTQNPSFKDIIIYRYAETCLLGAEAYLRKGNLGAALEYFNLVWTRAGNAPKTGTLTLQDILDEDAREFGQESYGHRWYVLKRFGAITMEAQIKSHSGCYYNSNINNYVYSTNLDFYSYLNRINYNPLTFKTDIIANQQSATNYSIVRNNFNVSTHTRWPIPISQINAMGGNYPQNPGYN
ncbi:RagB/SusD family nutrient uptake outer membrane protein [Flavobacterium sp.]|uniref:RagB/SusD family nutrient uptake outer membrane protein n=1 Tax=Flavobacterium sp. TaxID=239 RepID=UPI0024895B4A|nr:RagB/SusD family nutrient uptake outer membrane protein [Flavobacterium sp.]MDI1317048.1 RagB/SusD family nutrient uptake outer membrane protein [Flavobacterium sp.]